MSQDFHPAVEEYLEAIGWLGEEGAPVIQARLAELLNRSTPAVSEMLERLAGAGLLERSGRHILLTDEGRRRALAAIRRHRLAERLFVDVLGLPWQSVHAEAGRFGRVISEEVAEHLVVLLGDPATCPHGNPIPGSASPLPDLAGQRRLASCAPGQAVRVTRVTQEIEGHEPSLGYLGEGGFLPGTVTVVVERGPDGTLVVATAEGDLALSPYLCERIVVVPA
jgi:DtxR family Mn-dependent transcriptional regulator